MYNIDRRSVRLTTADIIGIIYIVMNVIKIPQYSLKHAAYLIGVSDRTVRRWIYNGKAVGYRVGGRQSWYLDLREINRLREEHAYPALSPEESLKAMELY